MPTADHDLGAALDATRDATLDAAPDAGATARSMAARVAMLVVGLVLMGIAVATLKRADLGLGPWDVFHDGVARHTGVDLGVVSVVVGIPLLLLWWPLRQWPGVGTVANVLLIGSVAHAVLGHTSAVHGTTSRVALLVTGMMFFALGQGLYLSAELGAGPRDGIMTGLNRRHGVPIWQARTLIETSALAGGLLLGGSFGVGTFVFAFGVGPAVQQTMRWFGYRSGPIDGLGKTPVEAIGLAGE